MRINTPILSFCPSFVDVTSFVTVVSNTQDKDPFYSKVCGSEKKDLMALPEIMYASNDIYENDNPLCIVQIDANECIIHIYWQRVIAFIRLLIFLEGSQFKYTF